MVMGEMELLDTTGLDEKYQAWLALIEATHHAANHRINPEVAFAPLTKPLTESTVALLTTAGAHLDDQDPFNVATVDGDPGFRLIPDDVDLGRLRFSHTHYDTASAEQDPNVVLPIDTLHTLVGEGRLGGASQVHIGMMGFNPDPSRIADETAPEVARTLVDADVDVAVLAPG
jgi:D-proline reductase (dithiol) PrdB